MKTLLTFLFSSITSVILSQGLALPYNSGYDSPAEKAGWQQFRTGVTGSSSWSYGGGGFAASCVGHDYNVGGNSGDVVIDWFVSPPLNFTAPAIMSLKVKTAGFSTPFPDNFEIWF